MAKQIFNAIVFTGDTTIGDKGFIKYRKISSLAKFRLFINGKYSKWRFATIYDNQTKKKLEVIKRL